MPATRWVVTCPDYTSGSFASLRAAQNAVARIESGGQCQEHHTIEETE